MSYFKYLPTSEFYNAGKISSSLLTPGTVGNLKSISYGVTLRDIMVRYRIRDDVLSSSTVFYPYTWKDSDSPDTLAKDYYGDEKKWWVVYYSNQAFDYKMDFPLPYDLFLETLARKYMGLYFATVSLTFSAGTGNFTVGEIVTDGEGFYGTVVAWDSMTQILTLKKTYGPTPEIDPDETSVTIPFTSDTVDFTSDTALLTADTTSFDDEDINVTTITGLTSGAAWTLSEVDFIGPETLTPANKQTILTGLQTELLHYVTTDGLIIDETAYLTGAYVGATPVYIFDKEMEINEAKRRIKLLDKRYVAQITKEFENESQVRRIRGR